MLKTCIYEILNTALRLFHSRVGAPALCGLMLVLSANIFSQSRTQVLHNPTSFTSVPQNLLIRIVQAEDERRWDNDVRNLLSARSVVVRRRAALAAGRIGNEDSVADLINLLRHDDEMDVRAMAAFALGEVESASAADALLGVLGATKEPPLRARTVEALGKIAAALPKEQEARARQLGDGILEALTFESQQPSAPDSLSVLLGLTAALRAKTSNGGPTIARFLTYSNPRIRADAANALARLRLKDGNDQLRKLLVSDADPTVRANAARVLGGTEDRASLNALLDRALGDKDSRVRVSAIRALASLKDPLASTPLLESARRSFSKFNRESGDLNELLEIAATLGRLLGGTGNAAASSWLRQLSNAISRMAPEAEIALVRISPGVYLAELGTGTTAKRKAQESILVDWRAASSLAQALGEIAALPDSTKNKKELAAQAADILRAMLDYKNSGITINSLVAVHSEYAIPDVLRALAAYKPKDLGESLRKHLQESDVVIRATAAELLGEVPPNQANTRALIEALPVALQDRELNDAALAILDSLAKQNSAMANDAIKTALDSTDHLIRRKAVALLKANGAGDFSSRIGTVQTRNTAADYERAIARIGKTVSAVVTTSKGAFTIQLLPDDAPLNVDNFVQLAKRGYFAGITFHRVVPNFVIQDGDPRGDGNGGPGYQIRCEINEVPYERGAVGMALSGKDTGGSQWFATHSPQP
ncbi:MAG: HEAT repeat domain-containing protein, partial [Acidobacteriota bacterium]|nr:HEAT repeat domain-containing protein [Acidobacteriota bacterium]